MLNKKILINISILLLGVNISYGVDEGTYLHCLDNKKTSPCEKSICLINTKLNHSERYYDVLLEYQLICNDKSVREGIISKKALWEEADFNPDKWDSEGPSLAAIYKQMFGEETEKRKRRALLKQKVHEFSSYFRETSLKWHSKKIEVKDYKVKDEFYKFISTYPYEKRTYKNCLEHSKLDNCEKSLCLAMTKLNKSFDYFKQSSSLSCKNGEILKAVSMKDQQWLYDNGRHPEDWDHEGAPEHVLKTMIDL